MSEDVHMCRICDQQDGEIPIVNNVIHPNLTKEIYNFSGVKVSKYLHIRFSSLSVPT